MKKLLSVLLSLLLIVGGITSVDARVFCFRPHHIYNFVEANGYEFVEFTFDDRHTDYGEKGYIMDGKKIKSSDIDGELRGLAHAYNNITKSSSAADFKAVVKKDIYNFEHLYDEFVDYTTNKDVFIESFLIYCFDQETLRTDCKNLYKFIKNEVMGFKFTDVSDTAWYRSHIEQAYSLGLMTGATETLFKPNANMNRGMVATVLYRMSGSPKTTYKKYFNDVPKGQYYSTAVTWAKQNGVINGYTDGTFKPLKDVTREEMVTMIYNYAKYNGIDVNYGVSISGFKDYKKVSSYAKKPMEWCYLNDIIGGKDNGTRLDPKGTATRAECAKMLTQAYYVI